MSRATYTMESCYIISDPQATSMCRDSSWHIWMRHVTHMNAPCHTYELVLSHFRMNRVTHRKESYQTSECVTAYQVCVGICDGTHLNESCQPQESVMAHKWLSSVHIWLSSVNYAHVQMSQVTRMSESRHTYAWVLSDIQMNHIKHNLHVCSHRQTVDYLRVHLALRPPPLPQFAPGEHCRKRRRDCSEWLLPQAEGPVCVHNVWVCMGVCVYIGIHLYVYVWKYIYICI